MLMTRIGGIYNDGDWIVGSAAIVPPMICTPIPRTSTQTEWVACSPEGSGFLNMNMLSGQAGVVAKCAPGARIWRIEIRYQAHDKRYIRGTRGIQKEEE